MDDYREREMSRLNRATSNSPTLHGFELIEKISRKSWRWKERERES